MMQSKQFSEEELKKKLMDKATYYLSKYASHSKKLKIILLNYIIKNKISLSDNNRKKHIDNTIQKCKDFGYLNDELYASNRLRNMLIQGKSKNFILAKLLQLGISKEMSFKTIDEAFSDNKYCDYRSAIRFIKRKKIGQLYNKTSEDVSSSNFNRWMSIMIRAGYEYDMAKKVLNLKTINDI